MKWMLGLLLLAQVAVPGRQWQFPRDDGAHAAFATEWWYFTGAFRDYGFELTFFRVKPDLIFTHFAITDIGGRKFSYWTRARRDEWGEAGAMPGHLWNENWMADFDATGPRHLHAAWGANMSLDLALDPGRRMLNGVNGWSQKGDKPGEASYYYSYPHIEAKGKINGHEEAGLVWMDHEFSSGELDPAQQGWDWVGLHLPAGDLMLFDLRRKGGARDPHSAGTFLPSTGAAVALAESDFTMTPEAWWNQYPIAWRVTVPRLKLTLEIRTRLDDQVVSDTAMNARYWEGAVTVNGGAGVGYLEMTGYGQRFDLLQSH